MRLKKYKFFRVCDLRAGSLKPAASLLAPALYCVDPVGLRKDVFLLNTERFQGLQAEA